MEFSEKSVSWFNAPACFHFHMHQKLPTFVHMIHPDILAYNNSREPSDRDVCALLAEIISEALSGASSKIWHAHPVWFIDDNPIVGYSKQKQGIRLMFWSGAGFDEPQLDVVGKKFKDASVFYTNTADIHRADVLRWLEKSVNIQWDYKNIVKRKGKLERLY
jgi:hypothetical protein